MPTPKRSLRPCASESISRTFFFQAEDGIRDLTVTGVQTCALPIWDGRVPHVGMDRFSRQRLEGSWRYHRSEEHTSELQSQSNLVCRLLLEKKKNSLPASTAAPSTADYTSSLERRRYIRDCRFPIRS